MPDDYEIDSISTDALVVIVIEKESSFSQLISHGCLDLCKNKCILVTGKGYPDVASRQLVKRLSEFKIIESGKGLDSGSDAILTESSLKIACLIDGDPHGFQIFLNYKFGSKV